MLSALTIADATGADIILHETSTRALTKAVGLVGVSAVRQSVRDRPQGHGSIDTTKWTSGKVIALEGEVWSQSSIEAALAEMRAITAPMVESLNARALMKWTEGVSGNQLQAYVELAGDVSPVLQEAAAFIPWSAQFTAESARAYSQTQQVVSSSPFGPSAGGLVFPAAFPWRFTGAASGASSCVNAGNDSTPPTFRIYGACSNPRIQLGGTTQVITLNGDVAAGDFVEVNVKDRSVLLNGLYNRRNMLDSANTSWFELPKGTSSVRLISATFDVNARLDVVFRSAYR